jgi:sugar/nucleoside kinase (ribokinase family)
MDQLFSRFDRVTIFGGATIDRIARSSGRPVMGASNPGHARRLPGGVGYNIATILARLGVPTRLVTRVGADADGEAIICAAAEAGVDTTATTISPVTPTAGYHGVFDDRGDLVIGIADAAVLEEIGPLDVSDVAAASHGSEFWVLDANLCMETLDFLVEEAREQGHAVAAIAVSPAKAIRLYPMLERLTVLFANRLEAAALLGENPEEKTFSTAFAARELARHGPLKVVVTGGNGPLAVASGGEMRSFTPLKTDAKAVNGAGDSFAAGTISGLARGKSLNDSIRLGLAAAALTVESGDVAAAPFHPDALEERIAGLKHEAAS